MTPCLLAQAPFTAGFNLQPILQAELLELGEFNLRAEGVYRSFFFICKMLQHHFAVISAIGPTGEDSELCVHPCWSYQMENIGLGMWKTFMKSSRPFLPKGLAVFSLVM